MGGRASKIVKKAELRFRWADENVRPLRGHNHLQRSRSH
jgi:hypothetical protein